jgi:hypothetical protein
LLFRNSGNRSWLFFEKQGIEVELKLVYPVDAAYKELRDRSVDIVCGSAHSADIAQGRAKV